MRLIGESYGRQTLQNAWREFNIGSSQEFVGNESNAELFFSWLFHQWAPTREKGHEVNDETLFGIPPTRAYLGRRSASLNPRLRLYLEACLATSPRFYEVLECEPGAGFRARDVLADSVSIVTDEFVSTTLTQGDILYAHLIPLGQITLMEAISPQSFPPHSKRRLLSMCQERRDHEDHEPELRVVYFALSASASR